MASFLPQEIIGPLGAILVAVVGYLITKVITGVLSSEFKKGKP